jgi:hypothetical protein
MRMNEPLDGLKALTAALREAGVSHYDGPVPGWVGLGNVKLILGPAPLPVDASGAPASEPAKPRSLTREEREDELDRLALRHVQIHGSPSPDGALGKAKA